MIADSGSIQLNKFGSDPALINGVDVIYQTDGVDITLANLKTNFEFIRLGSLTAATGSKTDAFQLANTNPANEDGYNPVVDLSRLSPHGFGIRIRKNSIDKLGIVIKDNLTGISTFNILFTGYLRLIDDFNSE